MWRRGLRFDDISNVDTPKTQRPLDDLSTVITELTAAGFMELLGTPPMGSQHDNGSCLFHDVVAHAGNAGSVSSQGAARLAPHNDNAAEVIGTSVLRVTISLMYRLVSQLITLAYTHDLHCEPFVPCSSGSCRGVSQGASPAVLHCMRRSRRVSRWWWC